MEVFDLGRGRLLTIMQGDLTEVLADAIVNAANERMLGGGGLDEAVHAAAGFGLYETCLALPEVSEGVRCPPGEARITPGFFLPARYVIHAVGPRYLSAQFSAPVLRRAHESCLRLAEEHGLESIAFPALSCGIFGYPLVEAAGIAVQACRDWPGAIRDIRFVLYGESPYQAWLEAARRP
jgi:O-acetyl-ADP-ribose deacetylase (regulator of RNase III)